MTEHLNRFDLNFETMFRCLRLERTFWSLVAELGRALHVIYYINYLHMVLHEPRALAAIARSALYYHRSAHLALGRDIHVCGASSELFAYRSLESKSYDV